MNWASQCARTGQDGCLSSHTEQLIQFCSFCFVWALN